MQDALMQDALTPASNTPPLLPDLFRLDAVTLARALIGWAFFVDGVGGVIVETEAYLRDDPASHSFAGPTRRNAAMFGPPGRAYVYRSYGMHWCFNVVCGQEGDGQAVLLRALEPVSGVELMAERRRTAESVLLCAGPGRLSEALGIDVGLDGRDLLQAPFAWAPARPVEVIAAPRIGISRATERLWRFGAVGSRYLSRPLPRPIGALTLDKSLG
jgi:DNA-3-methyladenine glycosylase